MNLFKTQPSLIPCPLDKNPETWEKRSSRYLKIVEWTKKRYAKDSEIVLSIGGRPSIYSKIETLAWNKYIDRISC